MPQEPPSNSRTNQRPRTLQAVPSGTAKSSPASPAHPVWPAGVAWLVVLALLAAAAGLGYRLRTAARHAWSAFATQIGGALALKNRFSPQRITGRVRGRAFVLETALSYEDEAPYYHTRGAVPLQNSAGFILGLRRKSLLEEVQTRREQPGFELGDPDFQRRFFVVCNDSENLSQILTPEARRALSRYHDIEIYARLGEIEWRRAGEQSDLRALQRLTDLLVSMAEAIDALPARPRTLSERLADEALLQKGV